MAKRRGRARTVSYSPSHSPMSRLHPIWPHSHRNTRRRPTGARIPSLSLRRVAWVRAMRRCASSSAAPRPMSRASATGSQQRAVSGTAVARTKVDYHPLAAHAGPVDRLSIVDGPARVRGLDDVVGVGVLLDDRVALVARDDVFDVGDLVTGDDREPPRVRAHGLVLGARQLDQLVAAEAAAFTQERDRATGALRAHGFVERAIRRLVHRDALLVLFGHADHSP